MNILYTVESADSRRRAELDLDAGDPPGLAMAALLTAEVPVDEEVPGGLRREDDAEGRPGGDGGRG